jgi:hypothetical protein
LPERNRLQRGGTAPPVGIGYFAERDLTGRRLGSLRRYGCWAILPVILVVLLHGGPSLVRIAGLCALIFAAGLATLELLLPTDAARHDGSILGNAAFLAVGLGPAMVLVVTIVLRLVGLYSPPFVLGSLMAIVVAALTARPGLRARCRRPAQLIDASFFVWLGCALLYLVIVAPQNDPFIKNSSIYLAQGFDLFLDKNPSEWPYFGEKLRIPIVFFSPPNGSNVAVFSSGDPF